MNVVERTPLLLVLAWLATNAVLCATDGRERAQLDRRIGSLASPAEQREAIFGAEVGPRLRALESTLDELARERHARVALAAPPPRNVFEALAWHRLYPTEIVALRSAGGDWVEEARAQGASVVVLPGPAGSWRTLRVDARPEGAPARPPARENGDR